MKSKLILAAAAASALLLSSCRKADEVTPSESQLDELEFTATIDGPSTKTTVNTDENDKTNRGKIEWVQGDTITIMDQGDNSVKYVATNSGATSTFRKASGQSAHLGSGPYTATYGTEPAKIQNYADHHSEVANQAKNVYMTTETPIASRSLTFKAACGLLKLTLTAKDNANEYITKVGVLNIGEKKDTVRQYWLTCGADGVSIKNVNDFYLTLPKGEYNRMVFYNKEDKSCEKQCKDENGMEIKDNIIQPVTIDDITFASARSVLLTGEFSVSDGKKVQFTSGNLWWGTKEGESSATWHLEESQTAYDKGTYDESSQVTSYTSNHVSHFYWSNLTDYQSGTASYMPYASSYSYSARSTSDKFFCGADNPLTVDGQGGLYALTIDEWYYLINSRTNASSLYKIGVSVTIGDKTANNCLVIAPDGYTGTIAASYSAAEWKTAEESGLVCLPAAGYRYGSTLYYGGSYGFYWSATPSGYYENSAYYLYFDGSNVRPAYDGFRDYGYSVRLVKKSKFYPGTELEGIKIGDVTWAPVNCGYEPAGDDKGYPYGLLYQWGRMYGQAYEKGTMSLTSFSSMSDGQSESNSGKFGKYNTTNYNWFSGIDNTLWTEDSKGTYDPCPSGWRVPTKDEFSALISNKAWGTNTVGGVEQNGYWFSGETTYSESVPRVFLPAAGYRICNIGNAYYRGDYGFYWSSSVDGYDAWSLSFLVGYAVMSSSIRASGYSVRCVQE